MDGFDAVMERSGQIADQLDLQIAVISLYKTDGQDLDIDGYVNYDPDDVIYEGEVPARVTYDGGWGESYASDKLYHRLTFGEFMQEADKAILQSGDHHHVFVEGYTEQPMDGYVAIEFSTGS